ncbi:hypothetical protein F0P96_14670 [Hymenobacter busanensis]|uniref:Uncharacterized protein n=1 Tax=Hymenobacter busanensis TaxID=2607656 RepID=A0A7L5A038_9BACT|nr:hypothetical protein [Hymenobacter busanensis]KAA9331482.1 hypothetical protein F0P96_14670 [Hymenobacter busanensis]QHJ08637.1 hypothetical protein GUY19_15605 [Hymenobacter busanensis]
MPPYSLAMLLVLAFFLAACDAKQPVEQAGQNAPPSAATAETTAGWHGAIDTTRQVPPGLALPGQLLESRRWTDAAGDNLLVVYRTKPATEKHSEMEGEQHVELFARQYVRPANGRYQELWRLQDAVRHCPFDMWLGPLPSSTRITDLDQDGTTETTLVYKLTCRSDVSPSQMKLIMHEGPAKYALRGHMVVQYDSIPLTQRVPANSCCLDTIGRQQLEAPEGYELYAGRYETEKEFRAAPRPFLVFARQQWRQWITQDNFGQLR